MWPIPKSERRWYDFMVGKNSLNHIYIFMWVGVDIPNPHHSVYPYHVCVTQKQKNLQLQTLENLAWKCIYISIYKIKANIQAIIFLLFLKVFQFVNAQANWLSFYNNKKFERQEGGSLFMSDNLLQCSRAQALLLLFCFRISIINVTNWLRFYIKLLFTSIMKKQLKHHFQ